MAPPRTRHRQLLADQGYDYIGDIGAGAYAEVNLFWSHQLKKNVAIKIINKQKAPRDYVKNFLPREIKILQKIKHQNITNIYEILATSDGRVFIVLEYSTYSDVLKHVQATGGMDEIRAKHIFGQVVEAVAYLHKNNIVHRDLKCENLLLTSTTPEKIVNKSILTNRIKISDSLTETNEHGETIKSKAYVDESIQVKIDQMPLKSSFDPREVKLLLTDFGFSKSFIRSDERSRSFCGSAAYAAPEVIQGIPYPPMAHDQWSLGVVLFIMVCGTMPYDDSNVRQMVREQLNHKIRFPPQAAINLSAQCKDLISKLIHPDLNKRLTIQEVQNHPWLINRLKYKKEKDSFQISSNDSNQQSSSTLPTGIQNAMNVQPNIPNSNNDENNDEDKILDGEGKLLHNRRNSNVSERRTSVGVNSDNDSNMSLPKPRNRKKNSKDRVDMFWT